MRVRAGRRPASTISKSVNVTRAFSADALQVIRPDQSVAIRSQVELREDPANLPASPRAPANVALVATGVPVLEVFD